MVILCLIYAAALGIGALTALLVPASPLLRALAADLAATLVVFIASMFFNNSSMYDPYWSVAPPVLVLFWMVDAQAGMSVRTILMPALVLAWAARLTANFLRHWKGMHHEDWRYADFRERGMAAYRFVSFTGFHFLPTLIVFAGCVPVYYAIGRTAPVGWLDGVAALVTALAIVIEAVADAQMRSSVRAGGTGKTTFTGGLWAYSRHPNYVGEVLFWWGLWLFAVAADASLWWTVFGPAGVTLLFVFISIPLMEAHMKKRRSDWDTVCARVPAFLPWFQKRS